MLDHPHDSCRPYKQRRPLTAIATRSFWNGVSDIKDVFAAAASASNTEATAQFYIRSANGERAGDQDREEEDEAVANDRFFEDITSLYRRQTLLFQRSCDQLNDIYSDQESSVSVFDFLGDS